MPRTATCRPSSSRRCRTGGRTSTAAVSRTAPRLIRELLEETKEAVGDTCGVVIRFAVDNLDVDMGITRDGDGRALVEYLAELPDLWDVNIANFPADARTARFAEEGAQEEYVAFVKQVTTKPVLAVGRYTSPDRMVSIVNAGLVDMIGAARPLDRRPLPSEEDRGRPHRGDPRMHRLQRLHHG